MSKRRNTTRRKRRGRFGFLYKLLSVLAICAVIIVALTLFFRVDTVEISGGQRYSEEEIRQAAGVENGDNLFLLNKLALRANLQKKLPYIETARINRRLPGTLLIDVTECVETLAVLQDGSAWLVSPSGKIVEQAAASAASGLPAIDGCRLLAPAVSEPLALEQASAARQESLLSLLGALRDAGMLGEVDTVHMGDAAALTMDYGGRFTVELTYGADYAYKLQNLRAVIDKLETNETGTINLRVDGKANFIPK